MNTVPLDAIDCELVTVTVCVPVVAGGVYKPVDVIVPAAGVPPTAPSTAHVKPEPFVPSATNCCCCPSVSAVIRGLMVYPVPLPVSGIVCGEPGALSVIVTDAKRGATVEGLNVTEIVQLALTATGAL